MKKSAEHTGLRFDAGLFCRKEPMQGVVLVAASTTDDAQRLQANAYADSFADAIRHRFSDSAKTLKELFGRIVSTLSATTPTTMPSTMQPFGTAMNSP
jgi:hypothetical protein